MPNPSKSKSRAKSARSTQSFKNPPTQGSIKGSGGRSQGKSSTRSFARRRPPSKGWPLFLYRLRGHWRELLEQPALWICLFLLVALWTTLPPGLFSHPDATAGAIAGSTSIAKQDIAVANEEATRQLQERAREGVPPVYDYDPNLERIRRAQIAELFLVGRTALEEEPEAGAEEEAAFRADLLARLQQASSLKIAEEQMLGLYRQRFGSDLEDRLQGALGRVLRRGVVSDKTLLFENRLDGITVQNLATDTREPQHNLFGYHEYPDEVREAIEQDLASGLRLKAKERRLLTDFLLANIAPNLTLNNSLTQTLRQEAAEAVGTVTHQIRKGEVIVRKGDVISPLAARALEEMAGETDLGRLLLTGSGTLGMLAGLVLLVWVGIGEDPRRDRSRERMLSEGLLLLSLHLLAFRLAHFVAGALADAISREPFGDLGSYVYAIPLSALALVSVLLYGRNTAVVLSLVFSLLSGLIVGSEVSWRTMVYCLSGSLAAIYILDQAHFRQRSVTTRAGFLVGVVNVLTILALELLGGELAGGLPKLSFDLVCGFASGLLAAAVTSFMIPILENLLSITTRIKLVELANPNLPLLRRLALEAPGTFQHSLAVANLAKAGCDAIDGDSLLINTCALYHDVGKVLRPQYFVENQVPGRNPHDKIQPSMSALILINHIKEGLDLALEAHLPQPILDGIEQHHGTRLIKFFYNRALERCDPGTEAIREEEFRYPGPKPQSKEMGILMLADAVEAASRTLVNPGRQKIRNLLGQIFEDCLKDGQLDQTDLTLGDLRQVEDAFQRVLTNIYHRRIDYPGFDFNREGSRRKSAQTGGEATEEGAGRKAS